MRVRTLARACSGKFISLADDAGHLDRCAASATVMASSSCRGVPRGFVMATSIQQITGFLDAAGLKYRIDDDLARTGFNTNTYRDTDGESGVSLVIAVEEDGEFLKIVAPSIYKYLDGPHKAALFQVLLMVSWDTKMVQFEYDMGDGEVRAIIEFPLEDAQLTQNQLLRCIHSIAAIVDENHERITAAMTKGELPKPESKEDMAALWQEFQSFLEQKRRNEGNHGLPG